MDEVKRLVGIKESISDLSTRKIRLEERFNNEKKKLETLLKEISDKGYDPQKLTEIRIQKEQQLKESLDKLETQVEETRKKLEGIEVQNGGI